MNIIELQDNLKDFSDNVLMKEMQSPSGNMPQFLVLSELTRRRRMRDDYKRQEAANMPTVAEEVMTAAGAPQEGLTAIARNMAPNSSIAQNTSADMAVQREPTRMPQMMAEGGLVSMANGGPLGTYNLDRNTMSAVELLRFQRPDQYNKYKENPRALERVALYYLHNSGIMPTEPEQTGLEGLEREPSFLEKFNPIPSLQAMANQTKIDQGQEARELEDRAASLSNLRASAPEDGSSSLQAQKYINDPMLDPSGGFSEPLGGGFFDLPESIIQARKMSTPSSLDFIASDGVPSSMVGGFDGDMSPVGTMPSQISEVTTPEFDDYFQSPLLAYPESSDSVSNLNASETAQQAADRVAQDQAQAQAADDYMANMISEMNREGSLEQPDQTPLFTSNEVDPLPSGGLFSGIGDANSNIGLGDIFNLDRIKQNIEDMGSQNPDPNSIGSRLGDAIVSGGEIVGGAIDDTIDKFSSMLPDGSAQDTTPQIAGDAPSADDTQSSALDNISLGGGSAGGETLSTEFDFDPNVDTSTSPLGSKVVKTTTASATGGDSGTGYSDPLRSRIQRMLDEREKGLESDKWLALAQTGMALMASDNPTLAGAIGEAGIMGLRSLSEARQQYDDDILNLMNMQYKLDVLDQESTTSGLTPSNIISALDDLRDYKGDLQAQLDDLDRFDNMMEEELKNQRRLSIQQEMFRTNLQLSQLRKSLGIGGGVQQAGNSFDVTGGSQTQSGLDLGTPISA